VMPKAIIKRLGVKAEHAAMYATALKTLAGAANVKVTLRGPWKTLQGNVDVLTPCPGTVWADGTIETPHNSTAVRALAGGHLDIEAKVEREVKL
jgi:hypothetical protein